MLAFLAPSAVSRFLGPKSRAAGLSICSRRTVRTSSPILRPTVLRTKMVSSDPPLTPLYPPIEPSTSTHLKVSSLHTIFYEVCGNPDGIPVVFVHGGPGGGIEPRARRFFDPAAYRIVLFDQRGCGRSTPLGSLVDNTTADLIADMEALRAALNIDAWVLFGGSWGSTLSLAYAQAHPSRARALILRGIFALRRSEIDWLYERGGAGMLAPNDWERYVQGLPEDRRDAPRLLDAFHETFLGVDGEAAKKAALAWSGWEGATSYFVKPKVAMKYDEEDFAVVFARIECHYFKNGGFFPRDGYLLEKENIDKIRHIPTTLVQGRWDLVCPIRSAHDLKKAFPEATLKVVPSAGHSAFEPGTRSELVKATDSYLAA